MLKLLYNQEQYVLYLSNRMIGVYESLLARRWDIMEGVSERSLQLQNLI
jgi:hypothetical protein